MVKNRFVGTAVVALASGVIAGCSSDPAPAPPLPGTLAAGTAKVAINGTEMGATQAVRCTVVGPVTTINTGDDAAGLTAVVASADKLTASSVSIRNLSGFTGSYNQGLGDANAKVGLTGRTFDISGTAQGFLANNPSFRVPGTFAIKVSC